MIRLKLPNFEGPLDLLLYLIRRNELDIRTISLAKITGEYLSYLTMLKEINLNIAGEYIVMAATLIKIKVRSILPDFALPDVEDVEDEAQDLIKKLKEYEKFKNIAMYLRKKEGKATKCYPRGVVSDRRITISGLDTLTYEEIKSIFTDILARSGTVPVYSIRAEGVDIRKRMKAILERFKEKDALYFTELLENESVEEIIVTFIAVLELVKMKKIKLLQRERFGRIRLYDTSSEMAYN